MTSGFDVADEVREWALRLLDDPGAGVSSKALDVLDARHPLDVARALRELPGLLDRERTARAVFGWYGEFLTREPSGLRQVAMALEQMAVRDQVPGELSGACFSFDDGLRLAETGTYGSVETVREEMIAFLESEGMEFA